MQIKASRLFILLFSLFIPLYIFYTFIWGIDFTLYWLPVSWQTNQFLHVMVEWVSPIIFVIAWAYFMIKAGGLLADSLDLMVIESSLSAHYFFFFGVNTFVLLVIFLIPVVSPIVAMMAVGSIIFTILTIRVPYDDLDDHTKRFVKIMVWVFVIPTIFLFVLMIPESFMYSVNLWNDFWLVSHEVLFTIMKALGAAISIGRIISLSHQEKNNIYFVELLIFIIIALLAYWQIPLVNLLYYLAPICASIATVINFASGKLRRDETENIFSIAIWLIFMFSLVLYKKFIWLQYGLILGSAILFGIYYILYLSHPKHDE